MLKTFAYAIVLSNAYRIMNIIQVDLNKDYTEAIRETVAVLSSGGTVVYPMDTTYGLGANALDIRAVEKVFKIKKRSFSKPLPIIVKNMIWVNELAYINKRNEEILKKCWPGKVTAVLPKKNIIPDVITASSRGVGIRIPDHIFVDKLLGKFGYPLTATSANIFGEEPTNDIDEIIEQFKRSIWKPDLIIDVGVLPKSSPSMIVDLTTDKPKILRVGPSKPDQFLKLLEF